MLGSDGNFYGTLQTGGANTFGSAFKLTPDGTLTVLHAFAGGAADGAGPVSLVLASDGNFYGTTLQGGASNQGVAFRMTTAGTVTILHSFAGGAGDGAAASPRGLIQATDGNLYGTTGQGGASNAGVVFRMTPAGDFAVLHPLNGAGDGSDPKAIVQGIDQRLYGVAASAGGSGHGRCSG